MGREVLFVMRLIYAKAGLKKGNISCCQIHLVTGAAILFFEYGGIQ